MTRFIEEHRQTYGVGSICRVLSIAPSAYYATVARQKNPCVRSQKDKELCDDIRRVWNNNFCVYGARKVWHQLRREGVDVARCTVERLMRRMGLKGVIRGKGVRTTRPDPQRPCPQDLVQRQVSCSCPQQTVGFRIFTYVFHLARALFMWPSSLTSLHGLLWVGVSPQRLIPTSYWMPLSRLCARGSLREK
ncbi:Transposase for insertion sequence element IS629 [Acetobacter pomorum DM001]|uniref:Transposase for insertion sequence element IS629 n=1 Tax=Acetobacter pomorum DM001 TaxID=945681 RepID=F1YTM3_9PROT|nr:Transposase for insertion sequence element IS629 [Acetobacter pomorum DM001]